MKNTILHMLASITDAAADLGQQVLEREGDSIFSAQAAIHLRTAQSAIDDARQALASAPARGTK